MPNYVAQIKGFGDMTTCQLTIITEVLQELATSIQFLDYPKDGGGKLV
jgi:hypothetical protein